jgi:two-component system nitrate/nitrite sensor histidine kinase NarX
MPANASSFKQPGLPLTRRVVALFWGKPSRPIRFLIVLLAGSAGTIGLSLLGYRSADWIALVLALASIGLLVALLHRVQQRLRFVAHLRVWAERMRGGDLSAKVPTSPEPDLANIIEDINSLGGMLERLAIEMDAHSHTQTVRLARKTQSLDILYEVALSLSSPGTREELLTRFLDAFIELVDARAATVHELAGNGTLQPLARRGGDPLVPALQTHCPHCGWSIDSRDVHILTNALGCVRASDAPAPDDRGEIVVVPMQYQDRTLGVYTLHLNWPVSGLGEDMHELLISIGRHLGLALDKARLDNDARQLAILYKKDLRAAQNEVRKLRSALDEAHSSLRELLANFRLRMDDRGLLPAITHLVQRFRDETSVNVYFHSELDNLKLTPAQEIALYYIAQEALTNIRKHSHAHNVRILLSRTDDGRYQLLIEDDGYGMEPPGEFSPGEQLGLYIMRERAERLPGELSIESETGEGTRVLVTFPTHGRLEAARRSVG